MMIAEGFRRIIYSDPTDESVVLKVSKDPTDPHNRTEWENWVRLKDTEKGKWLAPCVSFDGTTLVQKRVEITDTPSDVPDWIKTQRDWEIGGNQTKPWGIYQGHPVLVDYGDQLFRYLTEDEFREQVRQKAKLNPEHWGRETGEAGKPRSIDRWEYHQVAIQMLREARPDTILEAGTMGIQVAFDSDTIDTHVPEWNWRLTYLPTHIHDLTHTPWPIPRYDAFVALRVFHHMGDEERYLAEMQRIAKVVILALTQESAQRYTQVKAPSKTVSCLKTDTTVLCYL